MMSFNDVYLRNEDDEDQTIVTIYTYLKHNPSFTGKIYIISKHSLRNDTYEILEELYDNIIVIKPGLECKKMMMSGQNLDDITGNIYTDLSQAKGSNTETDVKLKIAVVCYVYYVEYFAEMYNQVDRLSKHLNRGIDMYVYVCDTNSAQQVTDLMNLQNPKSKVNILLQWVKNKGRDVRSFLKFIDSGNYKNYDLICKIHTKKTTYLHDNWREVYLERLLSPEDYDKHAGNLIENTQGISSVDKFKIQEKHVVTTLNYKSLKILSNLIPLKVNHMKTYTFCAGTMFWCTQAYCNHIKESINDLSNHIEQFPDEPIKNDGTLAHAWERAFWLL